MTAREIMDLLRKDGKPDDLQGMARFGIKPERAFGTRLPALRKLAKNIGRDHRLAQQLWKAGYRETRILASMLEEPEGVTPQQMDDWARDFTYWEICDQCCMNLFHKLPFAKERAIAWTGSSGEQQKRAGYALLAIIAWKNKSANDDFFLDLFPLIQAGAKDERPKVKKGVSWALRSIGKRNRRLNREAVKLARNMIASGCKCSAWVGRDVLKELEDPKQIGRLKH